MKQSMYNYYCRVNESSLLYNCRNDELILMNPELESIYQKYSTQMDLLKQVHPDFYLYLKIHGFIVSDNLDEAKEYISELKDADKSKKVFTLIVNPTMECNLNCWYCYEKKAKGAFMNEQTYSKLKALLIKIVSSQELEHFNLWLFGGEPLLAFNKIVKKMLEETAVVCSKYNKSLSVNFTSNATLLTSEMVIFYLHITPSILFPGKLH